MDPTTTTATSGPFTPNVTMTIAPNPSFVEGHMGLIVFAAIAGFLLLMVPFLIGKNGIIRSRSFFRSDR
jgi:hypothetical protein